LEQNFFLTVDTSGDPGATRPDQFVHVAYYTSQIKSGGSGVFWLLMSREINKLVAERRLNERQLKLIKESPSLNINGAYFLTMDDATKRKLRLK